MKVQKKAPIISKKPKEKKVQVQKPKTVNIRDLVKKNINFQFLENGKIKCKLTGHEMQATIQNFENYLKSKSYKRGVQAKYDISQYEQILIEHKDNPKFLYCQLTGFKIPKKKSAIEKHVKGKKFLKRLEQLQQQQNGQQIQVEEQEIEQDQQQEQNGNN